MRVFLIGLSGSGKSTVGKLLAERLHLPFLDTDIEVERRAGCSIPDIFTNQSVATFRALERDAIQDACRIPRGVVAPGGGAIADATNAEAMRGAGAIFWLDAPTAELAERLDGAGRPRPLLGSDPLSGLDRLRSERQSIYRTYGHRIDTGGRTPAQVAEIIARKLGADAPAASAPDILPVRAPSQHYSVYLGEGLLEQAESLLTEQGLDGPAHVIADERVLQIHGETLQRGLGDRHTTWHQVPSGEEHKNLEEAARLYDSLLAEKIGRDDLLLLLGGGVVGDLGGFVAATLLRGVRFVQVPTTLLAQVDSSVGGKVGIDHARGKNLIGAFHQPTLVLADIGLLHTLPAREIAAGWAEVVKISVALDAELFDFVEDSVEALNALEPSAARHAISRDIALKASLVEQDERDTTGLRALLNYGHTVGHAIEASVGYGRYLHGEAVAIGMAAAARIACHLDLLSEDIVARQERVLLDLGLPQRCPEASREGLRAAIGLDKKRQKGAVAWVLPHGLGQAESNQIVPDDIVDEALDWVTESPSPVLGPAEQAGLATRRGNSTPVPPRAAGPARTASPRGRGMG